MRRGSFEGRENRRGDRGVRGIRGGNCEGMEKRRDGGIETRQEF